MARLRAIQSAQEVILMPSSDCAARAGAVLLRHSCMFTTLLSLAGLRTAIPISLRDTEDVILKRLHRTDLKRVPRQRLVSEIFAQTATLPVIICRHNIEYLAESRAAPLLRSVREVFVEDLLRLPVPPWHRTRHWLTTVIPCHDAIPARKRKKTAMQAVFFLPLQKII